MFADYNLMSFVLFHPSLSPKFNKEAVFKAGEGAGRSGSFFFFSHDRKFIIKTMNNAELKLFLSFLPDYVDHFRKNKNSLLSKIFGVFTIKADYINEVHVMMMENTLALKNPDNLKYIFDLKGSMVDRVVGGFTKPSTTLKDVNFKIAAQNIEGFTSLGPVLKKKLSAAMRKDVEFLRSHNLMDYSLLLGIEYEKQKPDSNPFLQAARLPSEVLKMRCLSMGNSREAYEKTDIGEVLAENHRF